MNVLPASRWTDSAAARRTATWLTIGLMVLFAAWFSAYSIRLHDAHLTHKSDLGQMDQALWNTAHGRFVQETRQDHTATRMTDHVEPIFALVSTVFWLWDDVRAILIVQAVALAAGAWPIFLLARKKLADAGLAAAAEWGGAVFAAAYLLTPALQAPAAAEFHAMPLATPLIAAALWAGERRKWGWFVAWTILVAAVQEGTALLAATLGLYTAARALKPFVSFRDRRRKREAGQLAGLIAGTVAFFIGVAWFYIATFIIIPYFAGREYALAETPYAARYGELGDSFGAVILAMFTRPAVVLRLAFEPLRVQYLLGLLIPTAGLALFGPELLLASAPLLLANLFSAYPLQYSGELHYSAALVPFFVAAAAIGAARLVRGDAGGDGWIALMGRRLPVFVLSLVLICAVTYQVFQGFTPLGGEFRRYATGGWPQVTAHDRLLDRFAAQIPSTARLSVTTDLYPHLTHRQFIYRFPLIADAEYVLVDVTGGTALHPGDVKAKLDELLASGAFSVADAADGYLLLRRGANATGIPDAFYDFARAPNPQPQHPLDVSFGDRLRLIGYDVVDQPKWRQTSFRFYWQPLAALPADTAISMQVLTPEGEVADDTAQRPMPATLWRPPAAWQPGETYVTETLPWYQPRAWAPALRVTDAGAPLAIGIGATPDFERLPTAGPEGVVLLPAWQRSGGTLAAFARPFYLTQQGAARFVGDGWAVGLAEWAAPVAAAPGAKLPVDIRWTASGPAGRDYSVFVHLRDPDGAGVAAGDAAPTWFIPRPTSAWQGGAEGVWTAYVLDLPAMLAAGQYDLVAGWYDWQTGVRFGLSDGLGNLSGDEVVLGPVTVDPRAAPRPDMVCKQAPDSCASQEQ